MREKLINVLLVLVSCFISFVVCEFAYRVYLEHREKAFWLQPGQFSVYSRSIWDFDAALGFNYRPNARVDVAIMQNGIPRRCRTIVTGPNGSPGKGIKPADSTTPMFIVLGDSFTAMVHDGESWPDIFSNLIEERSGHTNPILNLALDSYGVLQMFDRAAKIVRDGYRPKVIIIAIIGPDLTRPRIWKMTLERNGTEEVFQSTTPSLKIARETHVRAFYIDHRVTRTWCDALRLSGKSDGLAKEIILETNKLRRADEKLWRKPVNLFSLTQCNICDRIRYGQPINAISRLNVQSAQSLMRFQDDPRFVEDLAAIRATGVPIWLVYLPYEPELRIGNRKMTPQELSLWESLKGAVDRTIDLTPETPMGGAAAALTMLPEDYHPSRAGLDYYAHELYRRLFPPDQMKN